MLIITIIIVNNNNNHNSMISVSVSVCALFSSLFHFNFLHNSQLKVKEVTHKTEKENRAEKKRDDLHSLPVNENK